MLVFCIISALIGPIFDGAWALISALHETEHELKLQNSSLENFDYANRDIARLLFNNILKQNFFGQSVI